MQQNLFALDMSMIVLIAAVAVVLAFLLLVGLLFVLLRRRQRPPEEPAVDLTIDINRLGADGPPAAGPRLEVYGTPVRLAALVLAPAGRNSVLPGNDRLSEALESIVPGLAVIVAAHHTPLRAWPCQLSTQGFNNSFFNHTALPGDRGKGSPWCCLVGRIEISDQQLLAGLVCVADKPNSLSQVVVPHVGQWMDVLRVRAD